MNDEPIHPLQAMINGMSKAWQQGRSKTQLTLGGLIKQLESVDPERKIAGLGRPMSYRGYYEDLAFEPTDKIITVAEALKTARECMGRVFEGYKGGEYQMGELTPIWSAGYGDSSCPRIMGLNAEGGVITLVTATEES